MERMKAWMNGKLVAMEEAKLPILSPSLGRGIAVFELMANEFLAAAGGTEANLVILLIGGEGWEKRQPEYARETRTLFQGDAQRAHDTSVQIID
jgi:hypothetical protein